MPQISFPTHTTPAPAKRYMWVTDAWSRSFSRQWKFNLTLIRLLSHKCHITCAKPRDSRSTFSMGKLQEVQSFQLRGDFGRAKESLKSIFNLFLLLLTQNLALASGRFHRVSVLQSACLLGDASTDTFRVITGTRDERLWKQHRLRVAGGVKLE